MVKIVITGHGSLDYAISALNLGAEGYISKPIKPEEIITAVTKRLEGKKKKLKKTQKTIIKFIDKKLGELEK